MKNVCCFCSTPVLGLAGCDTILDSVYLVEDTDTRIPFGHCHFSCIALSEWKRSWQRLLANNIFEVRGLKDVSSGHRCVGWNENSEEFAIVENGTLFWVSEKSVFRSGDRLFAQLDEEVSWSIHDKGLAESIKNQLIAFGSTEGGTLIEKLSSNSSYRQILSPTLMTFEDDPEETLEGLDKGVFEGQIRYKVPLSQVVAGAVSTASKRC